MSRLSRTISYLAAASLAVTTACAVDGGTDLEDSDAEIIGGAPIGGDAVAAIGTVAIDKAGRGRHEPTCTGTLVSPTLVLTAEQCVVGVPADKIVFQIGKESAKPRKTVAVRGVVVEDTVKGGVLGLGIDAALLHLREPLTDVAPLPVAALGDDQVGKRLRGFGFGLDDHDKGGVRRAGEMTVLGTQGRILDLIFGSFDKFLSKGAKKLFPTLDPKNHEHLKRLKKIHAETVLLTGVEAWVGSKKGDAQACDGDGGGPLTAVIDGKLTVVGLASWRLSRCEFGAGYTRINATILDLIARESACPLLPAEGVCDGSTVVRCSRPGEGPFRILRNDCAELDLTCGVDDAGDLTCVDPCEDIPEQGACDGDVAVRCSLPNEGPRRVLRNDCSVLGLTCGTDRDAITCIDRH